MPELAPRAIEKSRRPSSKGFKNVRSRKRPYHLHRHLRQVFRDPVLSALARPASPRPLGASLPGNQLHRTKLPFASRAQLQPPSFRNVRTMRRHPRTTVEATPTRSCGMCRARTRPFSDPCRKPKSWRSSDRSAKSSVSPRVSFVCFRLERPSDLSRQPRRRGRPRLRDHDLPPPPPPFQRLCPRAQCTDDGDDRSDSTRSGSSPGRDGAADVWQDGRHCDSGGRTEPASACAAQHSRNSRATRATALLQRRERTSWWSRRGSERRRRRGGGRRSRDRSPSRSCRSHGQARRSWTPHGWPHAWLRWSSSEEAGKEEVDRRERGCCCPSTRTPC